jgi:hypothetical protein
MPKIRSSETGEVNRLTAEIFFLRMAVQCLLPDKIAAVLQSYRDCATLKDAWLWIAGVAEQILDFAEPRPAGEMGEFGPGERAYCPLCGASAQTPYVKGFAFPNGLLQHLRGEGNADECIIMRAARVEAVDHVKDEFAQHLRKVRLERQAAKARKPSPRRGS